ncbi:MAG: hypothetical protein WBA74_23505 [Cyclobacteriaceae bacterium]
MKNLKSDQSKQIAPGIKSFMGKVTAKLFGIDNLIRANLENYLFDKARVASVPIEKVIIRLREAHQEIILFAGGEFITRLSYSDLFTGVAGRKPTDEMEIKKLSDGIRQHILDIAKNEGLSDLNTIKTLIYFRKGIRIEIYNDQELLAHLSIQDLINSILK